MQPTDGDDPFDGDPREQTGGRTEIGEETDPVLSFHWEGDVGEFIKVYLKHLVLTVLTLGVYYFWGKTTVRQYLWSHVRWGKDRFRYSGTGWELFVGFFKALIGYGIIIALFLAFMAGTDQVSEFPEGLQAVGMVALGIVLFGLYSYALYTARRYLLSRTEWRGLRFFQTGTGLRFTGIRLLHGAVMAVTLGLYYPWYRYRQLDYVVNHTAFGAEEFEFRGESWELARGAAFYLGLFVILPLVVGGLLIAILSVLLPVLAILPSILIVFYAIVAFPLAGFFYRAFEMRHVASNLRYRGLTFELDHSGWDYFRLKFFNGLLISLSGGLLTPVAMNRSAEYLEKHLGVEGSIDFNLLRQQAEEGPRHDTGEGLTEMFTRSVTLMGFFKL